VLLGQKQLKKEHVFRIRNLSDKIIFYPFPEHLNAGILDRFLYLAYMRFEWFDLAWIRKRVSSIVKNDYKRITGDLKVDHFVHYTGFGNRYSELIKHVPDKVNTVMYVHTDMVAEYKAKKNFSKKIIFSAYEQVDKVAVVHENLKSGLTHAVPAISNKLYVMNNFLGEERIRKLAKANLLETLSAPQIEHGNKENLISDLNAKDISTFINIGRFDYQKGHDRLIEAFEAVYQENQNTRLVIVAPHGPLRNETLAKAANSPATLAIYILGRMSNPYALLAKCGCFVLSSHYEGLGLVVYEALALGISVVTVDLKETTAYLQNDEAIITHNSARGIEEGMHKFLFGGGSNNEFDFSIPKERSKLEFEMLFM
jgi:glycosyltransferase involved in cell wall biosynthesis